MPRASCWGRAGIWRLWSQSFAPGEPAVAAPQADSPERKNVERWDFGDLPPVWKSKAAGLEVIAHPALVAEKESVAVRLLDYPGEAALAHEDGLVALATKQASQVVKSLRKSLLSGNELVLAFAAVEIDRKRLVEDVIAAAAYQSLRSIEAPRSDAAFKSWFDALRSDWHAEAIGIGEQLALALKAWSAARTAAAKLGSDYQDSQQDCWANMAVAAVRARQSATRERVAAGVSSLCQSGGAPDQPPQWAVFEGSKGA
jgi:ATP-dependent helicase HrpA